MSQKTSYLRIMIQMCGVLSKAWINLSNTRFFQRQKLDNKYDLTSYISVI